MTYRLSPDASSALEEIRRYSTEEFDSDTSDDYLRKLMNGFREIADRPDLGAPYGRFGLRSRLLTPDEREGHVAIYQIETEGVLILRVFHTRQNWQRKVRSIRPVVD